MLATNLTEEQRLSKATVAIMAKDRYVMMNGIMMIGTCTIDDTLPTARTNGRDEQYGRAFVADLTDAELRFIRIHEAYHKAYRHLVTWKHLWDEDPDTANKACDFVINLKITDENKADGFAVMPTGKYEGLVDEKYRGMNAAEVFALLRQDSPPQGDGQGQGEGEDEGDGQGQGQGDGQGEETGFDEHDWEGAQELSEPEKAQLARDVDEALRQGALLAGALGTGGDRGLQELLTPQVDWREVMREFVTTTCSGHDYSTYKRPNRRYMSAGVFMPSGVSERVEELVAAPDMSASIGDGEVSVILTELQSMVDSVKPERVRLLYWDTEVCQDEAYEYGPDMQEISKSTRPKGGGGTSVTCVPQYMQKNNITPQAVIVITDGYLGNGWGDWTCPVLWIVIDNKSATPPNGQVVHVETRNLR